MRNFTRTLLLSLPAMTYVVGLMAIVNFVYAGAEHSYLPC
jgi:hypothetical protein